MSTSREQVIKTITFKGPDRLVYDLSPEYGTDFTWIGMDPSPDARPSKGIDEWGAVWGNIGISNLGEVKDFPLKSWDDFPKLKIPDITDPARWTHLKGARERAGGKFLLGSGISIYERVHFIRGLENTWIDIYENRDELCMLLDILVDMNLYAIKRYAEEGVDGYFFCDDWGLQDRLMIRPDIWREIWKPRYERMYKAVHEAGMLTLLHSCGYIMDILEDLIEIGLDVIQMDQQENMGLKTLGEKFGGRITFFAPVDIQKTMAYGSKEDIQKYVRAMFRYFWRPEGGFIPQWYGDPAGAGHTQEAIDTMCQEFIKVGKELYR